MKAKVVTKVSIAAPADKVFLYLTDLQYHRLWNPHLRRIHPVAILQEGMQYRTSSLLFGIRVAGENKVTKLVPNRDLHLSNHTGTLHYEISYHLTQHGSSTQVTCKTAVTTESKAFAFAKPMMELLAHRELQSDLDALKAAVEQGLE